MREKTPTSPVPKYVTYKDYSGFKVAGTVDVSLTNHRGAGHMDRAFLLTAKLEAPQWGSVQSYDGCGMSAGPMHSVAVLPKTMQQGDLFNLLHRIRQVCFSASHILLALAAEGWVLTEDGKLRDRRFGKEVSGKDIRNTFTPIDGKVPKSGKDHTAAKVWATLFHSCFSSEDTFAVQQEYGIEYLIRGGIDVELAAYQLFIPKLKSASVIDKFSGPELPDAVDLAMCVYHSFTPNAPAIALDCLQKTLKTVRKPDPELFARTLIRTLGLRNYGRWKDVPGASGSRYDSCRVNAIASGLWPEELTSKLLPVDL